jgi:DTW domain-containing protein YfiP
VAPAPATLWQGTQPVLMFPSPEARPLEEWRHADRPLTLVVPDGTWRQANKARRRVPGLADLPCVSLPPSTRSSYRLRHDRRPDRVSTIEAIALALRILEGPAAAEPLEHIFRIMVDRTLWTNGRIATGEVTGGIPAGVRSHDPGSKQSPSLSPLPVARDRAG